MVAIEAWSPQGNGRSGEFYCIGMYTFILAGSHTNFLHKISTVFVIHNKHVSKMSS